MEAAGKAQQSYLTQVVRHDEDVDGVVVDVVEDVGVVRVHLGLVVRGEAEPSVRRQLKEERRCRELCCLGDQSGI